MSEILKGRTKRALNGYHLDLVITVATWGQERTWIILVQMWAGHTAHPPGQGKGCRSRNAPCAQGQCKSERLMKDNDISSVLMDPELHTCHAWICYSFSCVLVLEHSWLVSKCSSDQLPVCCFSSIRCGVSRIYTLKILCSSVCFFFGRSSCVKTGLSHTDPPWPQKSNGGGFEDKHSRQTHPSSKTSRVWTPASS